MDKNWHIAVSFIIHENFDHAWAEYYPVTINDHQRNKLELSSAVHAQIQAQASISFMAIEKWLQTETGVKM